MSLRFLIDEQLPPGLAVRLRAVGVDAEHIVDAGLQGADDNTVWTLAAARGAVLVSKDEDFVDRLRRDSSVPVVWIRFGNITNDALWRRLEPLLPEIVQSLESGETLIEVV